MAVAPPVHAVLDAGRQMAAHHIPPDIPDLVRPFIQPCLLHRAEKIICHGDAALRVLLLVIQRLQKILSSLRGVDGPGQNGKYLTMLAVLRNARPIHDHAVLTDAVRPNRLPDLIGPPPVLLRRRYSPEIGHDIRRRIKAEDIQQALHRDRPAAGCGRHPAGAVPLRRPVDEGPVPRIPVLAADFADQAVLRQPGVEEMQNAVDAAGKFAKKRLVAEEHHVIMEHQDVINGEARDHVRFIARIIAVDHTIIALRLLEITHALARKPVVRRDHVGVEDLRARVHRVLQLLIERAVRVGLLHTAPERRLADFPHRVERRIGGFDVGLHLERIAGLLIIKATQLERLIPCRHSKPDIAEGAEPERLIALRLVRRAAACGRVFVRIAAQHAFFKICPVSLFRQIERILFPLRVRVDIALRAQNLNVRARAAAHAEREKSCLLETRVDLHDLRPVRRYGKCGSLPQEGVPLLRRDIRFDRMIHARKSLPCAVHIRNGAFQQITRHDRRADLENVVGSCCLPAAVVKARLFPAMQRGISLCPLQDLQRRKTGRLRHDMIAVRKPALPLSVRREAEPSSCLRVRRVLHKTHRCLLSRLRGSLHQLLDIKSRRTRPEQAVIAHPPLHRIVQHLGGQHILSRAKRRGQINLVIEPLLVVPLRRSDLQQYAVAIQLIPRVCGNPDSQSSRPDLLQTVLRNGEAPAEQRKPRLRELQALLPRSPDPFG